MGLNAVNALSTKFQIESFREGEIKHAVFEKGNTIVDDNIKKTEERNGHLLFLNLMTLFLKIIIIYLNI